MALITRKGKGSRLSITEMDDNLEYLNSLPASYQKNETSFINWDDSIVQELDLEDDYYEIDFVGGARGQKLTLLLNQKLPFVDINWPESIEWSDKRLPEFRLAVQLDETFNTGTGFDGQVYTIEIQSDDKILVGGYFNSYNGSSLGARPNPGIARLNSDGTLDQSFYTSLLQFANVATIKIQFDGKILVGGNFAFWNGNQWVYNITRLNSDGSIDETFNPGTGFNGQVTSIALTGDKILVSGYFNSYNGNSIGYGLTKLNSDGDLDETFNIGTGFFNTDWNSFTGIIDISIQIDKILAVGGFNSCNGIQIGQGIVRLNSDGSLDETFNIGTGFTNSSIGTVNNLGDGKILVSGGFGEYNGTSIGYGIARLNSDGTLDETFNIGTGLSSSTTAVAIQEDGEDGEKILVSGYFDSFNETSIDGNVIKLNSDGSIDRTFNVGSGFNGLIESIVIPSEGKILFGGIFNEYNGAANNANIARLIDEVVDTYQTLNFYNTGNNYIGVRS